MPISIDPFVFTVVPGVGRVVTAIANSGNFGRVCVGSFFDEELTIDNGGSGQLSISNIISSSPDFLAPSVLSYPIMLGVGDAIDIPIRFAPTGVGLHAGTITITSNDPASPHIVRVFGDAPTPRLSLAIANSGNFGEVCVGSFVDQPLLLNNSGHCPVTVSAVTSSSAAFLVPEVLSFPLLIGPGDFARLADPLRPDRLRTNGRGDHGDEQRPRLAAHHAGVWGRASRQACRCGFDNVWRRQRLLLRGPHPLNLQCRRLCTARDQRAFQAQEPPLEAAAQSRSRRSCARVRACRSSSNITRPKRLPACCELVIESDDPGDARQDRRGACLHGLGVRLQRWLRQGGLRRLSEELL